VVLFILMPSLSWAGDHAATIYKLKCPACHGVDAAGKPAAKIPSLLSDDAKKATDDELAKAITEKPKHAAVSKSLAPDQAKMLVAYIRNSQKKQWAVLCCATLRNATHANASERGFVADAGRCGH
jgi:mono/diheme cytochrome c family protein